MDHNARTARALRRFRHHPYRHAGRACPGPARQRPYDRRTDLPRVLPLWPHELDDETPEGRRRILARLRRALRAERRRGVAGHWTYDLARHVELLRVYRLELAQQAQFGTSRL
jgi:hypothetical protein